MVKEIKKVLPKNGIYQNSDPNLLWVLAKMWIT